MFNHPFWSKPSNVRKFILGAILAVVAVYGLPVLQVGVKDSLSQGEKNRIDAENNARDVLVKAIGGGLLFATAWVGYLNYKSSQEKNIAERFQQYVEMLSSKEEFTCIAGIHGLEEIAKTNMNYYWMSIMVMASFIRNKSPWSSKLEEWELKLQEFEELPIQILRENEEFYFELRTKIIELKRALNDSLITSEQHDRDLKLVMGELEKFLIEVVDSDEEVVRRLDGFGQSYTHFFYNVLGSETQSALNTFIGLRGLSWRDYVRYRRVRAFSCAINLSNVNLDFMFLENADLTFIFFARSSLRQANLSKSDLSNSDFTYSRLEGTNLNGVTLENTRFLKANLDKADFTGVKKLTPHQLREAESCKSAKIPKYVYEQFTDDEERTRLGVICADS